MNESVAQTDGKEIVPEKEVENITTPATKGHVLDIAPGSLAVDLPCGWIHDGNKIETTAIVREMRGYEEDLLAAKGPAVTRLNAIIGNCVEQLGVISDRATIQKAAIELTAHDRMIILLGIRRVSLGDFFDIKVICPNPDCKVTQHKTLNLSEIEIIPMPDRMERERIDKMPSGIEIAWHVLRSEDEEWLGTQKNKKNDRLTLGLLARVDAVGAVKIDRVKSYREAVSALKKLSVRDRAALRDIFDEQEGSIDTKVEFDCDECGHTWEGDMEIGQPGFFFPSAK
jgi:hypothetical protein